MTAWLAVATLVAVGVATAQGVESEPPIREQHIVQVDGHPVAVWSRRPGEPHAVLLLVHGRTWSSLPDFDLQVPRVNRSVLVSMAARGIATYAVDLRGYGATPADSSGWLTPERAAADVQAVLRWVAGRHPDLPPPVLAGWSRGAAIALLAGQQAPELTSGLVVYGFAFDPDGTFVDEIAPAGAVPRVPNTAEAARVDFISPTVTAPSKA